jgi:hypothetical protein
VNLILDWRKALTLRFLSSQAHALQVAIVSTWLMLPADMRAVVPVKWVLVAVGLAGAAGFLGRMIDQSAPRAPRPRPTVPDDTDQAGA